MPAYSGKFQYLDAAEHAIDQGACEISFNDEICTVTPASSAPIVFDLGDVELITPAEWDVTLRLYTEKRIQLRQFGPAFERMCIELVAAWRSRTVRCLLLEDLKEVARFSGVAGFSGTNAAPSEIRIYGSNLAVLPLGGRAMQWRLAEVDTIAFDEGAYTFQLTSGASKLTIQKLGARTGEFEQKLRGTVDALRRYAAETLHETFPFLNPDELRQLTTLAPEGRSVKLTSLAAVHPELTDAIFSRFVSPSLRPYFDALKKRSTPDGLMTGFKFIRPDEESEKESGDAEEATAAGESGAAETEAADADAPQPLFFWFFFPIAGKNIVAWEATTGSGRATYFFRVSPPVDEAIGRLTRGLALVNFRREPVYLPDVSLDQQARYHRYAIGRRKLPELAELRAAFIGRAVHSSINQWEQQTTRHLG